MLIFLSTLGSHLSLQLTLKHLIQALRPLPLSKGISPPPVSFKNQSILYQCQMNCTKSKSLSYHSPIQMSSVLQNKVWISTVQQKQCELYKKFKIFQQSHLKRVKRNSVFQYCILSNLIYTKYCNFNLQIIKKLLMRYFYLSLFFGTRS